MLSNPTEFGKSQNTLITAKAAAAAAGKCGSTTAAVPTYSHQGLHGHGRHLDRAEGLQALHYLGVSHFHPWPDEVPTCGVRRGGVSSCAVECGGGVVVVCGGVQRCMCGAVRARSRSRKRWQASTHWRRGWARRKANCHVSSGGQGSIRQR